MTIRILVIGFALTALAACGADTATTAATGATIKKRELEEGKKTTERIRDKIGETLDQAQQRTERETDK